MTVEAECDLFRPAGNKVGIIPKRGAGRVS